MAFTYGIGKGLREPCSPFREWMLFGAELNPPHWDSWNCAPEILNPATSFDLSGLTLNHEVVVALTKFPISYGETYYLSFKWYRDRDSKLLFDYSTSLTALASGIAWAYSYIGYVDWEIIENGQYYVDIRVNNSKSDSQTLSFTVLGIPAVEVPEELPIDWLLDIRESVTIAYLWCKWVYLELTGLMWPISLLAEPFYQLYAAFYWVAKRITEAHIWAGAVAQKVMAALSWNTIWSYILSYVPNFISISTWFSTRWDWFLQQVNHWWSATSSIVTGWIDVVYDWAMTWIDWLDRRVNEVVTVWDDFVHITLPQLASWSGVSDLIDSVYEQISSWWDDRLIDIQNLINSAFVIRESFWAGWQELRDQVTEFFTDPEDWLYKSLDRIVERFW